MLASLLLLVSATLALSGGADGGEGPAAGLRARGWLETSVDCPDSRPGTFVEVENDASSVEALVLAPGEVLAAHAPLPEAPYRCHEIPEPHFVEEIL